MTTKTSPTLDQAVKAARGLPDGAQAELAREILERVTSTGQSLLNPEQRAEIRRRLAEPAYYATDEQMQALFARYGATYRTTL